MLTERAGRRSLAAEEATGHFPKEGTAVERTWARAAEFPWGLLPGWIQECAVHPRSSGGDHSRPGYGGAHPGPLWARTFETKCTATSQPITRDATPHTEVVKAAQTETAHPTGPSPLGVCGDRTSFGEATSCNHLVREQTELRSQISPPGWHP